MGFAAFLCPNHSRVLEDFRYGMNYDLNRHNNGKGGTVYEQHKILSGRKRLKGIPVLSAGTEQPVDKEKLLKYKEWLIANYAVNSVNSMLVALNQFLLFMEKGRLRLKRIKVQRADILSMDKALDKKEFLRLVRTARQYGKEQIAMIMETMCATGITVWSSCRKYSGKNSLYILGKNRIRSGVIFRTRTGREKNRSNIWKEMKVIGDLAGGSLRKVFPHNLRHLFARTFYRETKNLINLADILGHSNLDVTRGYASDGIKEWKRNMEKKNPINLLFFIIHKFDCQQKWMSYPHFHC